MDFILSRTFGQIRDSMAARALLLLVLFAVPPTLASAALDRAFYEAGGPPPCGTAGLAFRGCEAWKTQAGTPLHGRAGLGFVGASAGLVLVAGEAEAEGADVPAVTAVDAASGQPVWTYAADVDDCWDCVREGALSPDGAALYLLIDEHAETQEARILALRVSDGTLLWSRPAAPGGSRPGGLSLGADGAIVCAASELGPWEASVGHVACHAAATGALLWERSLPAGAGMDALVAGGEVHVATARAHPDPYRVETFDLATGTPLRARSAHASVAGLQARLLPDGDALFMGVWGSRVHAQKMDLVSGETAWSGSWDGSEPWRAPRKVSFSPSMETLYAIEGERGDALAARAVADGALLWRVEVDTPLQAVAADAEGVYAAGFQLGTRRDETLAGRPNLPTNDAALLALDLAGAPQWRSVVDTGPVNFGHGVVAMDGSPYVHMVSVGPGWFVSAHRRIGEALAPLDQPGPSRGGA